MAVAATSSPHCGGRGKSTSQDLVSKLRKKGLSDERVRAKLRSGGFKKARISQLMKATGTPGASSVRKRKETSRELAQKLRNQGSSDAQVRAKLQTRGLKKSRISQLMTPILARKAAMNRRAGSSSVCTGAIHQPANSIRKAKEKCDSFDIEKLVESEMSKRAHAVPSLPPPGTASVRNHCLHTVKLSHKSEKRMPSAVATPMRNGLKRKQSVTNEAVDIDDILQLQLRTMQLRKMQRNTCTARTTIPDRTRRGIDAGKGERSTDAEESKPSPAIASAPVAVQEQSTSGLDEVMSAAARISAIRKHHFISEIDWAFAILAQPARDVLSTQRAYRSLMRRLHPDKAGTDPVVVAAVDLLREATDICERSLCQRQLPGRPMRLRSTCVCAEAGRRQLKLVWVAPQTSELTPIHRYILAVSDPSFGKILTIATLEPDYSQQLKRYLAFDDPELCTYVVSEEHLKKMPKLFKADMLTVHVASGNREGQSDWITLEVCLRKMKPSKAH